MTVAGYSYPREEPTSSLYEDSSWEDLVGQLEQPGPARARAIHEMERRIAEDVAAADRVNLQDKLARLFEAQSALYERLLALEKVDPSAFDSLITKVGRALSDAAIVSNSELACGANRQPSVADPVDPASGTLILATVDLHLDGGGIALDIGRTYSSGGRVPFGAFGSSWDFSLNLFVRVLTLDSVVVSCGAFREDRYDLVTGADGREYFAPPPGQHATLEQDPSGGPDTFILTRPDGTTFHYLQLASDSPDVHRIDRIVDRFGKQLIFKYDGRSRVEVVYVNDPALGADFVGNPIPTRYVAFEYDSLSRITSARDSTGRTVMYAYDGHDNLAAVTLPATPDHRFGRTTRYDYASQPGFENRLTSVNDSDGRRSIDVQYAWQPGAAAHGKVERQRDDDGEWLFEYARLALGTESESLDVAWYYTSMVRPSGHRVELELNKNGNVLVRRERCLTEDGAWQVALYRARVNIDGNTVAQLSPGSTALLVDSLLTQSVFGRERFERANPGAVPGAADRRAFANLRETVQRPYASWPPSDTSLNQPGDIRRNFEYSNPFQLITAASDPRNPTWVTRYHYAPMATARSALPLPAALTSVEYPPTTTPDGLEQSAQSERFEHSTMGRLLRHIDTGGAVTELSYFDAGDSAPADDDAGRVVSIAGHLKTIRLGAGSVDAVTTFTVNGRGANLSICDARGGIVDYLLDSRDLPLRTTRTLTRPGASAVAYNVSRSYSGEGRLRRETRDVLDENGLPLQSHPEVSFFRYGDSGQVVRRSTGGADPRTWRTTRYVYDSQGRRTREISPEGTIVSTRFDARGNVTRRTFGLGSADASTVSTRYDTGGRKRAEIDARGNVTRFDYDAFGRVRRIVQVVDTDGSLTDRRPLADREGHTRLFSHDANGNVVQERMFEWVEQGRYRLLQRTESHFDERDRPIKLLQDWFPRLPVSVDLSDYETAPPLGATQVETWLFYDPAGRLREQRDGIVRAGPLSSSGSSAAYEYDELGRQTLVSLRLPDLGNAIVCSLRSVCDANGNLAAAVRADHVLDDIGTELRREVFISTAEYDSLNRRVADKDAFGRVRTYHYDSSDRLLSSSDPRGYVTSVEIDHHSEVRARTQQVSLAESIRTEYDYNRDGQVVEIRRLAPPAAPNRTRYDYDLIGRCARVIRGSGSPLAQIETLAYDARGNLTERHRPSGLIERMTYDAFDRPLRRELDPLSITGSNEIGGSLWEENTYDGLGRLVRASTDRTSVELELDSLGNVSRERQQVDGDEKQLLRTFDSMNRRRELLFPSGHRTRFDWDAAGRLLAILELSPSPVGLSGAALPRTVLKRSSVGQAPLEDAYWNGLSTKYIRDAAGHLIELDHCDSAGTRLGLVHLFDGCGNRIQDWQTGPDMNPERPSIAYLYDGQNALTHAYGSSGAQPATLATVLPPSSTLAPAPPADAVGLLIGPPDGPELARYSYDSGGNRAAEWLSAVESVGAVDALDRDVSALYDAQNNEAGSSLRRFDMRGRIVRDQNFSAVYDALGRRVAVRSGARLHRVVFDGASEIALYDVDNGYALLTEWTLTGHVDERIEIAHSGTSFVYHRDYVGSTRMVTGTGGETLARFEYDPYGRPTAVYDSVGIGHRFMGREWDEAVGLYHFRARHYDVAAGRFLQPDPADVNPRRSCYEAFGSNPLVFVDPMGTRHHHSWDPEDDIRQWDLATGRVKPTSIEEEFEAADAKYAFDAPVRELRDRQLTALAYGGALIAGLTTVVVAPEMLAAAPGWVKSTMGALALLPMIQAKDEKDLSKAILPHTSAASPGDLFASIVGWGLVLRTLLAKTKESTLAREPAPGPTSAEAARSADTRAKQLASFMDPRKQGAVVISVVPTVDPVTGRPGPTFVAATGTEAMRAAVRAQLKAGEVMVPGGASPEVGINPHHAEPRGLGFANVAGFRPVAVGASRPICWHCQMRLATSYPDVAVGTPFSGRPSPIKSKL